MSYRRTFYFFDLRVDIWSNYQPFLALLDRLHGGHERRASLSSSPPVLDFRLRVIAPDRMAIGLDGRWVTFSTTQPPDATAYRQLAQAIATRVRSHILIHAGVVARDGHGVVLVGDTMHGKTTLALELVRRGWHLLSDDVAAFGRCDRLVYPFPRRLSIRPHSLHLLDLVPPPESTVWYGKYVVDIADVTPGNQCAPVPVRHVVVLGEASCCHQDDGQLVVSVDRLSEPLIAAISTLDGVTSVTHETDMVEPTLVVHTDRRVQTLSAIEQLCHKHGLVLLDFIKRRSQRPAFADEARLEPVAPNQAVMELLRRFLGGHASALFQEELQGSSIRLFLELAAIVDSASFWRLRLGSLAANADRICELIGAG